MAAMDMTTIVAMTIKSLFKSRAFERVFFLGVLTGDGVIKSCVEFLSELFRLGGFVDFLVVVVTILVQSFKLKLIKLRGILSDWFIWSDF